MGRVREPETDIGGKFQRVDSTLWTLILQAKDLASPNRQEALDRLIHIYWKPAYLFVRRKGHSVEDTKDLVQGFFTEFLDKDFFKSVERTKGRFRNFLLACLQNYMADAHDHARAKKRGGAAQHFSLDVEAAEQLLAVSKSDPPQELYDRNWAITVLERGLTRLREEFQQGGKIHVFEGIKRFLSAKDMADYSQVAEQLHMSPSSLRVTVHRARKRYGELIREEVRGTVDDEAQVEKEIEELYAALLR